MLDRGRKTDTQIDGKDMQRQREANTDIKRIEREKKSVKEGRPDPAGGSYC